MPVLRCLLAIPFGIIVAACSGSFAVVGDVPDSAAGDDANSDGAAADSGGNADTSTSTDTGTGSDTMSGAHDAGTSNDGAMTVVGNDGGGCPNVMGGYGMLTATGGGCGTLSTTAKQCIRHPINLNACQIQFLSEVPNPPRAVNGPLGGVVLKPDGTFDPVTLLLDTSTRSNCSGVWDEAMQTMTVTCASGGGCVITMVKTSATCP